MHGAWHGAWAWELLIPELEARGHTAVAMDLPCDDGNAGFADYADVVANALIDRSDVILVGHSLGGMTVPLVAAKRAVRSLVFLCAMVPNVGDAASVGEPANSDEAAYAALVRHADGSHSWPTASAAERTLYQDCSPALVAAAFSRLRRQQTGLWDGLPPLDQLPNTEIVSILCAEDRAISPAWSRWVARNRLGVEAIEMPGGHSPMMSRPAALADLLVHIAEPPAHPDG